MKMKCERNSDVSCGASIFVLRAKKFRPNKYWYSRAVCMETVFSLIVLNLFFVSVYCYCCCCCCCRCAISAADVQPCSIDICVVFVVHWMCFACDHCYSINDDRALCFCLWAQLLSSYIMGEFTNTATFLQRRARATLNECVSVSRRRKRENKTKSTENRNSNRYYDSFFFFHF